MYCRHMDGTQTVALGSKTFTVVSASSSIIELAGKRGGRSSMTRNLKHPSMWAHIVMAGYRAITAWYVRNDDGTFTKTEF